MRTTLFACASLFGMLTAPALSNELTMMQTAKLLSNMSGTTLSGKCSLKKHSLSNPESLFPGLSGCGDKKGADQIIVVRSGDSSLWGATGFGTTQAFGSGTPFGRTNFASGTRFGRSNGFGQTSIGSTRFGRLR